MQKTRKTQKFFNIFCVSWVCSNFSVKCFLTADSFVRNGEFEEGQVDLNPDYLPPTPQLPSGITAYACNDIRNCKFCIGGAARIGGVLV